MFLWVADVLIDMRINALRVLDKSLWVHSTEDLTHLMAFDVALKFLLGRKNF